MSAAEADAFRVAFGSDREVETAMAALELQLAKLRSQLSAPRAGRLREQKLAEAYALVLADTQRITSRGLATFGASSEQYDKMRAIEKYLEHREIFLK